MNDKSVKSGILFAIAAYTMWGIAPLYFKLIGQVPAMEILMHRIVWSVLVLVVLVGITGKFDKVKQAVFNPKVMQVLLISGVLLAANWFIFIWAINNNHLLDASLGYYINPLLNIFLGRLFLGERLRRLQKVAVGLALFGVVYFIVSYGQLPWVALALAGTFGVYGLLRKQVAVDSLPGLLVESSLLLPPAIVYWVWFAGEWSNMLTNDSTLNVTLICAGIVTTAPLLCFTAAAKRIMFSTLGFFQYIGPSIMFVLAAAVYDEPLDGNKIVMFGFVWLALGLFSYDSLRQYRKIRKALKHAQD
ncbi:EamA family transporter RarD [uncultured Paraglaciecola sp.]|jgi:chloramphenicol-sensitive protein RarD|uniref:EamA family transporter RarD n=1 Tax=uncultured Paraglaciecola sp. TaxID=1765024 RepID=UPI0030D81DC5|tara:strand:+ start:2861 stop:3769 length:909 start_codon:yes stop_codon:yes gene_type:complete